MPDQSSAADEHALLQEITAPLETLPDDAVSMVADVDFPLVLRGYDRLAVDAYVKKTSQLVAELQATRSPEAAIRRAIERVGEQISGILQRAHDTAEQITTQSRREAEDRLQAARDERAQIAAAAEQRVKDLDIDTDRIWAERQRIVEDARGLARQLLELAEAATERFPPADTEPPTGDTDPSAEYADPPADEGDPPAEYTDPPADEADPPADEADPPAEYTDPPADEPSPGYTDPPGAYTGPPPRPAEPEGIEAAEPESAQGADETVALPIFKRQEDDSVS